MKDRRLCPTCGRRCRAFNYNMTCASIRRKELKDIAKLRMQLRGQK